MKQNHEPFKTKCVYCGEEILVDASANNKVHAIGKKPNLQYIHAECLKKQKAEEWKAQQLKQEKEKQQKQPTAKVPEQPKKSD